MAITLVESANLSQNKLIKGVIQEVYHAEDFMKLLPFAEVEGNALAYNREDPDDMGSVGFKAVNGVWTESTATVTACTASIYPLGEDADVDNLIGKTRSNINPQMATQVRIKSKLMARKFMEQAVYGVASTSNGFDGMHTTIASSGSALRITQAADATGAAMTCLSLDAAIDACEAGKPDCILMSKQTLRNMARYLRTVGSFETTRDEYGNTWKVWGDNIPIATSDWLYNSELCDGSGMFSAATTGATSSIFVIKFGDGDGLIGLQNGGIATETWEKLETKDASRTRLKWYVGMALYSTKALVRVGNITNVVWTA